MAVSGVQKINEGKEDEMVIEGYNPSMPRTIFTILLLICSGGTLLILLSWRPRIRLLLSHSRSPLEIAKKILLIDVYNQVYIHRIKRDSFRPYFFNKKLKYIWKPELCNFAKIGGLQEDNCAELHALKNGMSTAQAKSRLDLFGENKIQVEVKPVLQLVFNELKGPFYIYQVFIVIIWSVQLYLEFAICIVLLSVISVTATVWETRKQSKALRDAIHSHSLVSIIRDGQEVQVSSVELVPGDILVLESGETTLECDAVLLEGGCVVNESMLTGESIPITKTSLPTLDCEVYSIHQHKRNTIFCGTTVLHSRSVDSPKPKAIVIRTGYATAKGELVRAILFPKPIDFKLYSDLYKSMICFLVLGLPAMLYTGYVWTSLGARARDIAIIVLDVATFVVPPVLPAVLTSINAHGQLRLRRQSIFCLNTRYINFCGGLDIVCFDKTGTLTEDGLNFSSAIPIQDGKFETPVKDFSTEDLAPLFQGMASCHSLALVHGKTIGYTLDLKVFQAIGWILMEPEKDERTVFERTPARIVHPPWTREDKTIPYLAILKEFPFESALRRMTVVTRLVGETCFQVFTKGAPEMIQALCLPETVPSDFDEVLEGHARQGFRMLAIASKKLKTDWEGALNITRESLEKDMSFEGLLVLQNPLKPETAPALNILKQANIRTIMVTGDNMLTALTVAGDCGMIEEKDSVISVEATSSCDAINYRYTKLPGYSEKLNMASNNGPIEDIYVPLLYQGRYHLAIEGTTFDIIRQKNQELLYKVVQRGTIFARMAPDQKLRLIEILQRVGYQVGMCGDGANDCGALKTAHAGISLSMAEASVASPFTSKVQNITCVPTLIREGRATLTSTFGAFRYMVCYCFVLLSAVLIMFWDGQKPTDGAYVMIDIILCLMPPFFFGWTGAYPRLHPKKPIRSILSFLPQLSMFSFILIQIGVYILAYYYCKIQPWYQPFNFNPEKPHRSEASHLGTTVLSVNMMSYVIASVIFAPGPPYRRGFFSNKPYLAVVVFNIILVTLLVLHPPAFLMKWMNIKRAPYEEYHVILYAFSLVNFGFSYIWEVFILQGLLFKYVAPLLRSFKGNVHLYEQIEQELQAKNSTWPPVGHSESLNPDGGEIAICLQKLPEQQTNGESWPKQMSFATFQDIPRSRDAGYNDSCV